VRQELAPVQAKRQIDGKWFYTNGKNELALYNRPTTWWSSLIERLYRCIWRNQFTRLENKVADVTALLADYITTETDEAEISRFCIEFTPVINELIRTAEKLHQLNKFERPPHYEPLKELFWIPDNKCLGIQDRYSKKMVHPYSGHISLDYKNNSSFRIERWFKNEGGWLFCNNTTKDVSMPFSSSYPFNTFLQLEAIREEEFDVDLPEGAWNGDNFHIYIGGDGQIRTELSGKSNVPERMQICLHNYSSIPVDVQVHGHSEEVGTEAIEIVLLKAAAKNGECTTVQSDIRVEASTPEGRVLLQNKRKYAERVDPKGILPKPPKADAKLRRLHCVFTFKQIAELPISCKAASYSCTINSSGVLETRLKAWRVVERTFEAQLGKGDYFDVEYKGSDKPSAAIVLLASPTEIERGVSIHNRTGNPLEVDISTSDGSGRSSVSVSIPPNGEFAENQSGLEKRIRGALPQLEAQGLAAKENLEFKVSIHEYASPLAH
jgi:hypothetical protein